MALKLSPSARERVPGHAPTFSSLDERGIGLAEVIASTLIAALAVVGLAYSFGIGRGLIDRYEIARNALGQTSGVLDSLTSLNFSPAAPDSAVRPFLVNGLRVGTLTTLVDWVDDPLDGLGSSDPDPRDLKKVRVRADWGLGGTRDALEISRMTTR